MDQIKKTLLPGGAVVITSESHAVPVSALHVYVRNGSLHEGAGEEGFAHFLEHLAFRGTRKRPQGRVAAEVEALGGNINAWTSYELTSFHALIGSSHTDIPLDLCVDLAANPLFPESSFEIERRVVLEEIRKAAEEPDQALEEELFSLVFGDHALSRPIYGSPCAIKDADRDQVVAYHRDRYRSGDVLLVAVGDFDADHILELASERLDAFPEGRGQQELKALDVVPGIRVALVPREVEEDRIALAFPGPSSGDERAVLSDLLASLLGGSENSIIYKQLVRDEDLFNDLQCSTFQQGPGGAFLVNGWSAPGKFQQRVKALLKLMSSVRDKPPERTFLDRAVRRLTYDRIFQRETVEGEASRLGLNECVYGDPHHDQRYQELLRSITPRDLQDYAHEIIQPEQVGFVAMLSDDSEARAWMTSGEAEDLIERSFRPAPRKKRARHEDSPTLSFEPRPGLSLLLRQDSSVPILSTVVALPGGQRFETPETAGLTTLLADTIARGTKRYSAEALLDLEEEIGGALSIFAGRNSIGLELDLPSEHQDRGVELLTELLFQARFPKIGVDFAKRLQLEEIRAQNDDPSEVGMDALFRLGFEGHTLGLPLVGTQRSVRALTKKHLVGAYHRHVAAGNVVVAMVGDVDPERVLRSIEANVPDLPVAHDDPFAPKTWSPPTALRREVIDRQERKTELLFGFRGVSVRSDERFALELLTTLLAGQSGRLFEALRETHGGVYDVDAVSWEGLDAGMLALSFTTSAEGADACVAVFWDSIRRVLDEGFSDEEIQRARRSLIGGSEISCQRRGAVAYRLAYDSAYRLGIEGPSDYARRVKAVTRDQLSGVCQRSLGDAGRVEVVLRGKS